jgi:hypothetical protein
MVIRLPILLSQRTASIRAKIQRAEKHISDLNVEVSAFLATNPYSAIRHDDPKTGNYELRLWTRDCLPQLLTILGDAIHNLRSALDHLACELVRANGGTVTDQTAFPIARSKEPF